MGRTARGVTGMRFKIDGDYLVSMAVIHESLGGEASDEEEVEEPLTVDEDGVLPEAGQGPEIMVISDGGMGKRSLVTTYRKTRRGAKGVVSMKLRDGELVVDAVQITPGDELLITTERGLLVRIPVDEVRQTGRAAKGVRIMNLNPGDKITGVARLISDSSLTKDSGDQAEEPETVSGAEDVE